MIGDDDWKKAARDDLKAAADIDWRRHFALTLGLALGGLYRDKVTNQDSLKLLLNLPGAKELAREEPNLLLGAFYREFGISFEEDKT